MNLIARTLNAEGKGFEGKVTTHKTTTYTTNQR